MEDEVINISKVLQNEEEEPFFKSVYNGFMDLLTKKRFAKKWAFAPVDIRLRCTNKCETRIARIVLSVVDQTRL